MAICSISATRPLLPLCNSFIFSKPTSTVFSFPTNMGKFLSLKSQTSISSNFRSCKTFVAPEILESEETTNSVFDGSVFEVEKPGSAPVSIGADEEMMAPKQRIRIKLKSYWVPLIEDSCKQIMDVAKNTNAKTMGPVPLPTKKRVYCLLKSPHVHKDARFHFEIRTHQRLIDILYPTAQTIDSLMQLDLPAGVDVNVKL